MTPAEVQSIVLSALQGLVVSTGFLLTLFIGFCVVVGFTKFRKTSRDTLVVRNLADQMDGAAFEYLSPHAPHGPADQLHTPELLEQSGRKE